MHLLLGDLMDIVLAPYRDPADGRDGDAIIAAKHRDKVTGAA
jgi:hypothetical protein